MGYWKKQAYSQGKAETLQAEILKKSHAHEPENDYVPEVCQECQGYGVYEDVRTGTEAGECEACGGAGYV